MDFLGWIDRTDKKITKTLHVLTKLTDKQKKQRQALPEEHHIEYETEAGNGA